MRIIFVFAFAYAVSTNTLGQNKINNKDVIGLSFGSLAFGTGDFLGYGVNIEYSKRLNIEKPFLKHFAVGVELSFDEGNEQPKVIDPSLQEFFDKWHYSTANLVFTSKITYYPFIKTFAKGLNISGGLSVGYTNQNFERQATYISDSASQMSVRRSYLGYINRVMFG